jgi:hypothetical protein
LNITQDLTPMPFDHGAAVLLADELASQHMSSTQAPRNRQEIQNSAGKMRICDGFYLTFESLSLV